MERDKRVIIYMTPGGGSDQILGSIEHPSLEVIWGCGSPNVWGNYLFHPMLHFVSYSLGSNFPNTLSVCLSVRPFVCQRDNASR